MILNDELNEEIGELKKELQEYSNEINYIVQIIQNHKKMIKTIEELKEKIDIAEKENKRTRTKNRYCRKK